jgi:hypothetical protein
MGMKGCARLPAILHHCSPLYTIMMNKIKCAKNFFVNKVFTRFASAARLALAN